MANEVDYSPQQYNGNGTTKTFSFDWKVFEKTDLIVSLISNGVTTPLTLGTDYQASIEQMGGTVTLATAPAVGDVLRIERLVSQYQSKRYSTSTGFQGEEIEKSFDRNSCNIQDMQHTIDVFKSDVNTEIGEFENSMDAAMSSLETATTEAISNFETSVNSEISSFETATNSSIASIQSTANTALSNSQSAVTTANTASDNASTALSNSQSAVTTANTASDNASTALSNSSTALSNSQSAVTTANSASSTATAASDKVDDLEETIQVVIDAAEQIEELQEAVEEATEAATDAQQAAADAQAAAAAVVIDQTFDGTSTHAQSGVAIAGAGFINSSVLSAYATRSWVYSQTDAIMSDVNDSLRYRADLTLSNITSMGNLITSEFNQVYDELATKISGITTSDVTNALGYTPVNKTGDTMTGVLICKTNSNPPYRYQATDVDFATLPSSDNYHALIEMQDNSARRMGRVEYKLGQNGEHSIGLVDRKDANTNSYSILKVGWDANGNSFCDFPYTTCCDGQWVNNSGQLASDVSLAIGNDQRLEYNISSYLPNDNYSYEVRFSIDAQTGSGSGAGLSISLIGKAYNNVDTWVRVCNMYARGSWAMVVGNSAIVPIGTDRKVKLNYTVISKAAQLTGLHIEAYRRIGTNA